MLKKSKIALSIVIGGYLFNLLFYLILYHIFYGVYIAGDYFAESAIIILAITILYFLVVLVILSILKFKKRRPSLIIPTLIVTILTFLSISSFYFTRYHEGYGNSLSLKHKKTSKTFDAHQKNKVGFKKNFEIFNKTSDLSPEGVKKPERKFVTAKQEKALRQLEEDKLKLDASEKVILKLQEKLELERIKTEKIQKQLKETSLKVEDKDKIILALQARLKESNKRKGDILAQAESKTIVSIGNEKKTKVDETASDTTSNKIIFKVQILSSATPLPTNSPKFKGIKNIWEYKDGILYKYTVGNNKELKSASALQSELRKKGFGDAFVVAFQNGKRIPVRKALKLLK